jgi:hypothetical protein
MPSARSRANLAGAIYGQIVATSVVATLSEDEEIGISAIFAGVGVTLLVFWLAHLYARAMAAQLDHPGPLGWREVRSIARDEWPIAQAAVPTLIVLALGWVGAMSERAAIDIAIGLGVALLFAWGYLVARSAGLSPGRTVTAVLISGSFGVAIVVLKILVH